MPPSKSIEIAGANVGINTHTTTISMESKVAGLQNEIIIPNADLERLYSVLGNVIGLVAYKQSKTRSRDRPYRR